MKSRLGHPGLVVLNAIPGVLIRKGTKVQGETHRRQTLQLMLLQTKGCEEFSSTTRKEEEEGREVLP
jgi:hypothetical protein